MPHLKDQRILVTGGSGFLGRHVVKRLRDEGLHVDAPSSDEFPMRVFDTCLSWAAEHKPNVIVNLAAFCGGIGKNAGYGSSMLWHNLDIGMTALNVADLLHAKCIQLGSVCSYPKHCPVPFKETDLWNGYPEETNAPYGIAKRTLMVYAQTLHPRLDVACLLPANLYGPGDHFDDLEGSHVIPAMIRKMVEARDAGEPSITLWGTGRPTREFLYVEDCADAIVQAIQCQTSPAPINIGTGVETSIHELAETIKRIVGYTGRIKWDVSKPDGQPRRQLDTTRAKAILGWKAKVGLQEGLERTVESYEAQRSAMAAT